MRVVNAFTSPVDVLIDGQLAIASLAVGAIDTALASSGGHTVAIRQTGSAVLVSQSVSAGLSTVAVVRSAGGALSSAVLDDTNSVVPAGATKVRVLHLAPNAGTIQVYRTQPDYQTPISWQFPFTYQSEFNSSSAPFYQSTVGTWDVRAWQSPADASGWAHPSVKVLIPLSSGEKKTVIILDAPGGGIRVELL
ncbi:MAG TPA: DUF4397 domain-containing protein [Gemmatimonadaceae bacterium]|nr:DUF4397 domain-containing protein [Gemmatimonadaceae bacterium]